MANLFGTGINQVPTNGMLGNLAFQDKAYVSVDKVGIGTTAVDTGTANQTLQNYGGAYVSGNLGIGTTNPTYKTHILDTGATGAGLLVQGGGAGSDIAKFQRTVNGVGYLSINCSSSTPQLQFGASSHTISLGLSDSLGGFEIADNTVLGTNTRFFVARSTGNVGIGVTNPQDELHLGAASNIGIRLQDTAPGGGSYATINYNDSGSGVNALTLSADEGNTGANTEIRFNIDGSEVSRYAVGGQLLVGTSVTTGTANQKLQVTDGAYVSGNTGIGTTNPTSKLSVVGDGRFTGVVTATTFIGALTGTATTASSVTVDSVGLGTHTYGDYVKDITGTANQITVISGTGEGSSPILSVPNQFTAPQDVTVTRDLQVNRNLNVNGNITIGGTSATLFTTEFKVYDPDIVLGFRTDANNNDVSTDNTANHGGIAIASTEGTPLISLYDVGVGETNPATYKKFMWFKSGTFSGLGTDAWLSNYAIGIGSTQFPSGTRLAAGSVQFTERDLSVVRNINASGVVTATTFVGALSGTATSTTNIPNLSGDVSSNNTVTTLATVNSNVGTYGDAGAIPSITVNAKGLVTGVTTVAPNNGQLSLAVSGTGLSGSATFTANQSGSSTFTVTSNATDANTPSTIVARDSSGNFSAGTITANLTGTATTATNLADAANITTGTINSARLSGTYDINVSYANTAGIATVAQGLTGTPNITVGVVTATSFVKSGGTSSQFLKADGSVDSSTYLTSYTETDTLNSVTGRGNSTANGISVGILTATSGNFSGIITSSGANISGVVTATSFSGSGTNLTGIVTSIVAGTNVTISGSTGQVTINATGGGGGGATAAELDILEVMLFV